MRVKHNNTSSPVSDFESVDYLFEIGGKNKGCRQIVNREPSKAYIIKDDIEHATLHSIHIWVFGFLY